MYLGTLDVTAKSGEKGMADKKEDLAGPGVSLFSIVSRTSIESKCDKLKLTRNQSQTWIIPK